MAVRALAQQPGEDGGGLGSSAKWAQERCAHTGTGGPPCSPRLVFSHLLRKSCAKQVGNEMQLLTYITSFIIYRLTPSHPEYCGIPLYGTVLHEGIRCNAELHWILFRWFIKLNPQIASFSG